MAENHRVLVEADHHIWEERLKQERETNRRLLEEMRQSLFEEQAEKERAQHALQDLQSRLDAQEIANQEL